MKIINCLASPLLAFVLITGAVGRVDSEGVDPAQALVSNCIKQRKNASFLADGPPF